MALQYYREDDGMTLFYNDGSIDRLTPEETEHLDRIAYHYNKYVREEVPTRPFELAQIFPESKTYLLARNKEINKELKRLLALDVKINDVLSDFSKKDTRESLLFDVSLKRSDLVYEQERNKEILACMGSKGKRVRDFNAELMQARTVPIDRFVRFRQLKAKCLWHNDRNPSMHYYKKKNKVYCFSCQHGGDVLDVVMKLRNCTLREAISFVNNT